MIKEVSSKTRLIVKGRVYVLVWEDGKCYPSPCERCALFRNSCRPDTEYSLQYLCDTLQEEFNTYFVERTESLNTDHD